MGKMITAEALMKLLEELEDGRLEDDGETIGKKEIELRVSGQEAIHVIRTDAEVRLIE
jgi:hypothetical protein